MAKYFAMETRRTELEEKKINYELKRIKEETRQVMVCELNGAGNFIYCSDTFGFSCARDDTIKDLTRKINNSQEMGDGYIVSIVKTKIGDRTVICTQEMKIFTMWGMWPPPLFGVQFR
jgi:hypothetical protein